MCKNVALQSSKQKIKIEYQFYVLQDFLKSVIYRFWEMNLIFTTLIIYFTEAT